MNPAGSNCFLKKDLLYIKQKCPLCPRNEIVVRPECQSPGFERADEAGNNAGNSIKCGIIHVIDPDTSTVGYQESSDQVEHCVGPISISISISMLASPFQSLLPQLLATQRVDPIKYISSLFHSVS